MQIRSYIPDYAYVHPKRQNDPGDLVGIYVQHEDQEVDFLVEDNPRKVASALESLAAALRRRWPLVERAGITPAEAEAWRL